MGTGNIPPSEGPDSPHGADDLDRTVETPSVGGEPTLMIPAVAPGGPGGPGPSGPGRGSGDGDNRRRNLWLIVAAVFLVGLAIGAVVVLLARSNSSSSTSGTTTSSTSSTSSSSTTSISEGTTSTVEPSTTAAPDTTAVPSTAAAPSVQITDFRSTSSTPNCSTPAPDVSTSIPATVQQVTLQWTTEFTTRVDISVDGPGVYQSNVGAASSITIPYGCPGPHEYLLTAHGANGTATTKALTITATPDSGACFRRGIECRGSSAGPVARRVTNPGRAPLGPIASTYSRGDRRPVTRTSRSDEPGARDDATLVVLMRAGDLAAFEELYVRHRPAVSRTVAAIVRNREHTSDVVQEAFTRALDRLATLRDPERFVPWLLSIARHVATDHVRDLLRVDLTTEEDGYGTAEITPGPEELAELAELARLVGAGITRLSTRDATAVALVTHLGFTPAEVGLALGVSQNAAKVIVHRARRRLRDALFMELLARGYQRGCADRPPLHEDADRALVLKHVLACDACSEALTSDVRGYDSFAVRSAVVSPSIAG